MIVVRFAPPSVPDIALLKASALSPKPKVVLKPPVFESMYKTNASLKSPVVPLVRVKLIVVPLSVTLNTLLPMVPPKPARVLPLYVIALANIGRHNNAA